MAKEIERKFLVGDESFKLFSSGVFYRQGYLNQDKDRTVRVRIAGDHAYVTIKGLTNGLERLEFEYLIPIDDANEMLETICIKPLIEKYRYRIESNGHLWEVDEFVGDNEGLIVAEVELQSAEEYVIMPDWVGKEVTGDVKYFNSNLVINPFKKWGEINVIG